MISIIFVAMSEEIEIQVSYYQSSTQTNKNIQSYKQKKYSKQQCQTVGIIPRLFILYYQIKY